MSGFGGDPETVAWQLAQSKEILEQNGAIGVTTRTDESQQHLQESIQEFSADNGKTGNIIVKVNLKRTDIADFSEHIMDASWAGDVQMMALLGNGVLYLTIPFVTETDFQCLANAADAAPSECLKGSRESHHRNRTA